jgi:predicted nucleotidyltransferase component of viral defense system
MIKPGEIQKKAREAKVRDQQIEKDYILSWILQGIAQHGILDNFIVFKGGTALKKGYFEDYRFSEDLDFTLLDDTIPNRQIIEWFQEVFEYVNEEANITLEIIDPNSFLGEQKETHLPKLSAEHIADQGGINFYISYVGPLGGQRSNKKIKIDISRNEKLVFETVYQNVIISYSDQEPHHMLCYSLEEVLVEKLRSVMQRMQPRDFYDIWYLLEIQTMDINFYISEFKEKCFSKKINPTDLHTKLEQRLPQYRGRWQNSLADQIHDLPDFEQVEREVMRHLKKFVLS